jgi:hypothetical protein|tara:strand:+ start:1946 stop:2053 length:108 start_codon:yes stop_codon:yes gene_type:complete
MAKDKKTVKSVEKVEKKVKKEAPKVVRGEYTKRGK